MTDPAMNDASQNERLDEILAAYLDSERSGQRLDRQRLLAENADLADELQAFFADHDRMKAVAEPLRVAGASVADEATLISSGESAVDDVAGSLRDTDRVAERLDYDGTNSSPRPGSVIRYFGDYELLSEIARGGMGVVYKARQVKLNRVVALKMILSGVLAGESEVKRFLAEAEAAANLDHPGIVPIFEVGEHGGQHFFSMGFVEGQSLAAKLSGVPLEPREAAELLAKIAEAVQFAHDNGVIHRDLKPANVLLDQKGQPRVTDFGLAKKTRGDSNLTGSGQILGTPSYMPPEQAAGNTDQIGPVSDVYALGAILYALLTGRPPFQAASPMDTLLQVLHKEPVAPRQLNASVPLDLETICLKCLQKDSRLRYPSARALADDLRRFSQCEPIHARPLGIWGRLWRSTQKVDRIHQAANLALASSVAIYIMGGLGSCLFIYSAFGGPRFFEHRSTDRLIGVLVLGVTIVLGSLLRWFGQRVRAGQGWALWAGLFTSIALLCVPVAVLVFTVFFVAAKPETGPSGINLLTVLTWLLLFGFFSIPLVVFFCALRAYFANRDQFPEAAHLESTSRVQSR